jgi:hypothetical protein
MSKVIKIYCEGTKGSHDYDILEKIIPTNVKIEPIGSKKGAGSAIQVFEKLADKSDYFFLFRDRDFDKDLRKLDKEGLFVDDVDYKKDNMGNIIGQWCFSYRTTIENYLFDVQTFYNYLENKNLLTKYNVNSVEDIKNKFIIAAKRIKNYQAVRHTLGEMREIVDFGTTWEEKSGKLPKDLSYEFCKNQALKCIKNSKKVTENWTEERFEQKLIYFIDFFDNTFFEQMLFLIWFQGKDFASSLLKDFMGLDIKSYYKFAKQKFDYKKFLDLIELQTLLLSKL